MKLFRGISDKELKNYRTIGIPKGKRFTTDIFRARKFGKNVIEVPYSENKFEVDSQSDVFKTLKIKETYYKLKKPIKQFKKLEFLE